MGIAAASCPAEKAGGDRRAASPCSHTPSQAATKASLPAASRLAMTPADQTVTDAPAFAAAMRRATELASDGAIVTLGVVPTRPETGYGYIEASTPGRESAVKGFVEKPDAATAERRPWWSTVPSQRTRGEAADRERT